MAEELLHVVTSSLVGVEAVAPTARAVEMHAGEATASTSPSFPEAATVTTPRRSSVSMARVIAGCKLSHAPEKVPPPRLRFTAATGRVLASAATWSNPARTSLVQLTAQVGCPPHSATESRRLKTWTAEMLAPRPVPEPVEPWPATMPATCVPWPQARASYVHGAAEPGPR